VRAALALLIGTELWGFVAPADVDLAAVRAAAARSQPYYAVPSQFLALPEFPMTKNGKVDKAALRDLAARPAPPADAPAPVRARTSSDLLAVPLDPAMQRFSVANGGVPYHSSLPGTPYIPPSGKFDLPQWSPNAATFSITDAPVPVPVVVEPVPAPEKKDADLPAASAPEPAPWLALASSTTALVAGALAFAAFGALLARRTLLASS
jgi:hypothetical protein